MAATMVFHRICADTFTHKPNTTRVLCCALKWNSITRTPVGIRHHHAGFMIAQNLIKQHMRNTTLQKFALLRSNRFSKIDAIRFTSSYDISDTSKLIDSSTQTDVVSETHLSIEEISTIKMSNTPEVPSVSTTPELPPVSNISNTPEVPPVSEKLPAVNFDSIPEPPTPLVEEIVEAVQTIGEPTFVSQGLGGWSPVGIVQNCMEYLHITCDLPWWISIMIGTIVVRTLIFPLVITAQRNAAKMNNHLPQLQVLQLKMTEARQAGNQLDAARYGQEMMLFMREKQLNPFKNMLVPLAQAPLFISFFMGLRGMANAPVESMRTGGLFWFEDLTMPDQFFLLPIITSCTMWLTIELGTDSARLSSANMQTMKYVLRALPVIILPFTVNFPGAILCYWVSTNFISLAQVGILRIPAVRDYFKIDKLVVHNPDALPVKPKGFVKGMKESWTNMKITKEMEERQRFDEVAFQRAGRGPIQKTFKYDPTQPRESLSQTPHISAKKRD